MLAIARIISTTGPRTLPLVLVLLYSAMAGSLPSLAQETTTPRENLQAVTSLKQKYLETGALPEDADLYAIFPILKDFPPELIASFRTDFDTLGDARTDFIGSLLSLSPEGMKFTMTFYQAVHNADGVDPYDVVVYAIDISAIRENVEYIIRSGGDVRNGDATNIVDVVLEAQEYIPSSKEILTVEYLEDTRRLYEEAYQLVMKSFAASTARLKESGERLKESDERLKESDERLKESDERLKESDERLKESDERLRASIEEGERLDKEIERLKSVISLMRSIEN